MDSAANKCISDITLDRLEEKQNNIHANDGIAYLNPEKQVYCVQEDTILYHIQIMKKFRPQESGIIHKYLIYGNNR